MRTCLLVPALAAAAIGAAPAVAQTVAVGDAAEDRARLESLVESPAAPISWAVRPNTGAAAPAAGLSLLPFGITFHASSAFPWGQNDGAVWRGKGLTTVLDGGVALAWRRFSLVLRPALISTGNAEFALIPPPDTAPDGYSKYAYPYHRSGAVLRIDMPLRFGGASYWTFDPGQSHVAVRGSRFYAAAGTDNLWWGPARHNAIVLSNNAAGFPHLRVGTSRPVSVGIGAIEVQWAWGRLAESRYFDTLAANDRRYFTGMVGTFQPRPLPGLWLGATRAFIQYFPAGGLPLGDYFLVFQGITKNTQTSPGNPTGNDARDQLASLFGRWAPAGSGFEAYAEWARNDHNSDMRDLLIEPEHSQGFTVGFQQAVRRGEARYLVLGGELTHLERSNTSAVRPNPPYYIHHVVRQGYTHRGQVLGAGVGPGGNAQRVELDWVAPWGRLGGTVVRQVRDNDAMYARFPGYTDSTGTIGHRWLHDVTVGALLRGAATRGPWTVSGELGVVKDFNRYNRYGNDVAGLVASFGVRWAPAARAAQPE